MYRGSHPNFGNPTRDHEMILRDHDMMFNSRTVLQTQPSPSCFYCYFFPPSLFSLGLILMFSPSSLTTFFLYTTALASSLLHPPPVTLKKPLCARPSLQSSFIPFYSSPHISSRPLLWVSIFLLWLYLLHLLLTIYSYCHLPVFYRLPQLLYFWISACSFSISHLTLWPPVFPSDVRGLQSQHYCLSHRTTLCLCMGLVRCYI